MSEPVVSVWCLSYNHEKYLANALEGIVMQKTNFPFEVWVHDDASTDGSANIIREYEKENPHLIHGIYQNENQMSKIIGQMGGQWELIKRHTKGKYIALCECDDCWIDANKLQIQIDYMEAHEECVMSIHDGIWLDCRNTGVKAIRTQETECDLTAEDIIMQYNGHPSTASFVFRRELLEMNDFFLEMEATDYPLQLYALNKGKIHYFDRVMSVYRFMSSSSHTVRCSENEEHRFRYFVSLIDFMRKYDMYTSKRYSQYVETRLYQFMDAIFTSYSKYGAEHFENVCDDLERRCGGQYHYILNEMKRLFRMRYDENYIDDEVKEYIANNPAVVIWGAGVFGKNLAKQFQSNGIYFEGFIVTDGHSSVNSSMGKPVWKVSDISQKQDKMGIVVAINPCGWKDLVSVIEENRLTNYIYPFKIKE